MSVTTIERTPLATALLARAGTVPRLASVPGQDVTIYDSPPPPNPPSLRKGRFADPSGVVAPYVWLQVGGGARHIAGERDLAGEHVDLSAVHQLTCVAGSTAALWDLVDAVDAVFYRWCPVIDGLAFGRMEPPDGYDPGVARVDERFTPARLFVPLQYRLDATT